MHVFLSFITMKGIQPMYKVLESDTSNLVWRVQRLVIPNPFVV